MPVISMFYGIIVRMFKLAVNGEHTFKIRPLD